jgi:tetratricopeptide (TPR) repeat protein
MKKGLFPALQNDDSERCPPPGLLQRYCTLRAGKRERRRIEEHLDLCPACLEAVQQLMSTGGEETPVMTSRWAAVEEKLDEKVYSFLRAFQAVPAEAGKGRADRRRRRLKWFAGVLFGGRRFVTAGLISAAVLCGLFGAAYLRRPAYYQLARPDRFSRPAIRSALSVSNDFTDGLDLFFNKKYGGAVIRLNDYHIENPDDFSGAYYLGLSYLYDATVRWMGLGYAFNQEKAEKAVFTLEKGLLLCGENLFNQEDCRWYLGKAYLMQGELTKALEQFRAIAGMKQPNLMRREEAENMAVRIELQLLK